MDAVRYDGSDQHDALVAQWFLEIKNSGDLANLFCPTYQHLGRIYAFFQRECAMVFQVREGRIVRLAWFEPQMSGAFFGCWVTPALRSRVETIHWIEAVSLLGFEQYKVLIATTKQDKLLDVLQRFGYTLVGAIPYIWQGEAAWVLSLVKEDLVHGQRHQRRRDRAAIPCEPAVSD